MERELKDSSSNPCILMTCNAVIAMQYVLACSKWSTSPTLSAQEPMGIGGPASAGQSARVEAGAYQVKIWIQNSRCKNNLSGTCAFGFGACCLVYQDTCGGTLPYNCTYLR